MSPTPRGTGTNLPGSQPNYDQYTHDAGVTARESYRIKDGSGGKSIFIPEVVADFQDWKASLGVKVIDIIMGPAGKNHPLVVSGKLKEGQMTHICWAYVHKGLGPNQDWFICPSRTYGHRCPACEERARIMANSSLTEDQVKNAIEPFNTGRYPMGIYNMVHHLNPQHITWQEPVMYWSINNSFMESKLQSMSKAPMGGGFVNYMWPTAGEQGGRHISFEVIAKGKYFDYIAHAFFVRQQPVPLHILQQARCLDEMLYVPTYDELKEVVEITTGSPAGSQPTGEGAYVGPGYEVPPGGGYGPVFGSPLPQQGRFPECKFGITFENYEECADCTFRVQCQPALVESPGPALAPAPGLTPPPGAPIPRRVVK